MFIGTAKPMLERRTLRKSRPPRDTWMAVLIPNASPELFSKGPPELPGPIKASVCNTPAMGRAMSLSRVLPTPLITPTVTDPSRPKGLPMAMAIWPGRATEESPRATGSMPSTTALSTFRRAKSLPGLVPRISASKLAPFWKFTLTRSASCITWLLVTMWPWWSIRNPEPEPNRVKESPPLRSILISTTAGLTRR